MSPKLEFRPLEFPSLNEAERAGVRGGYKQFVMDGHRHLHGEKTSEGKARRAA